MLTRQADHRPSKWWLQPWCLQERQEPLRKAVALCQRTRHLLGGASSPLARFICDRSRRHARIPRLSGGDPLQQLSSSSLRQADCTLENQQAALLPPCFMEDAAVKL